MAEAIPLFQKDAPLADKLRPATWDDYRGLSELDSALVNQLREGRGRPPSLILWGPPGGGKTTLAKLIGKSFAADFVEFSAVLGGVKDVREIVARAKNSTRSTILFVDEIHRFNKAQQDAFLPHIEDGTIILIGATTENPSFTLNNALISRAKVVVLPPLSKESLEEILQHASETLSVEISNEAIKSLTQFAGGDARRMINLIENLVESGVLSETTTLTPELLEHHLKNSGSFTYDRDGEEHYNMASAFIKSLRGTDPDAALYWGFRMIEGGEDPRFLFRRLIIFASEDIGNADPRALQLAVSASDAFERIGLPEGKIPLAQCITYLASAPKSNRSYAAMHKAISTIHEDPRVAVPLHLRNAPTKLMKNLEYGKEYQYPHNEEGSYIPGLQYLPEELQGKRFYEPSEEGLEGKIKEKLDRLRQSS